MNLGKYIRNAAITTAATAAILAFACGHGADAQKQAANNSVHRPYVQNHINPEIPATYVFNEIAGNCKLTPIYFEPRFFDFDYSVGNNYDRRVVRIIRDLGMRGEKRWVSLGTGYQISPNLVLTANHVATNSEGLKNILDDQVLDIHYSDGTSTTGRVVASKYYEDLTLVEVERPRWLNSGTAFSTNIFNGSEAEVRTIEPIDQLYQDRSSQISIPLTYEGEFLGNVSYIGSNVKPGMSGSSIFNSHNRIVGVLVKQSPSFEFEISSGGEVVKEENAENFISMSSSELVRFLDEYCNKN